VVGYTRQQIGNFYCDGWEIEGNRGDVCEHDITVLHLLENSPLHRNPLLWILRQSNLGKELLFANIGSEWIIVGICVLVELARKNTEHLPEERSSFVEFVPIHQHPRFTIGETM